MRAGPRGRPPALGDDRDMQDRTPPPPTPSLRLRLHGDACILAADGRILPLRGRAAALAALAALEPGIRRERAAALLWPESPTARQNLRQQLLRFRQALGAALIEGDDAMRLAQDVQLEVAAPGACLLGDETGFDEAFGQWLEQRRQAERQSLLQPLIDERSSAEAAGNLDHALRCAQQLLALEPQQEEHHAALMRLHYLRGEPAAGLSVYQRLAEELKRGIGSRPAAATEALASALRSTAQLPAAPTAPCVPRTGPPRTDREAARP